MYKSIRNSKQDCTHLPIAPGKQSRIEPSLFDCMEGAR
jgi:hypothetical protein